MLSPSRGPHIWAISSITLAQPEAFIYGYGLAPKRDVVED